MLERLYKSGALVQQLFIILAVALLWIPRFFSVGSAAVPVYGDNEIVFQLLFGKIQAIPYLSVGIALLLLLISALFEQRALSFDRLHVSGHNFPMLAFILLASMPHVAFFSPVSITLLILVFALRLSFIIPEIPKNDQLIFFTAFLFGLASIFYLPSVFLMAVFIAIFTSSAFTFKNIIVAILGFLLPCIWFFGIIYLSSDFSVWIDRWMASSFTFSIPDIQTDMFGTAVYMVLILIYIFFIIRILSKYIERTAIIRRRTTISIFLILVILGSAFFSYDFFEHLSLLAVPITTLISYYYNEDAEAEWLDYALLIGWIMLVLYPNLQAWV